MNKLRSIGCKIVDDENRGTILPDPVDPDGDIRMWGKQWRQWKWAFQVRARAGQTGPVAPGLEQWRIM